VVDRLPETTTAQVVDRLLEILTTIPIVRVDDRLPETTTAQVVDRHPETITVQTIDRIPISTARHPVGLLIHTEAPTMMALEPAIVRVAIPNTTITAVLAKIAPPDATTIMIRPVAILHGVNQITTRIITTIAPVAMTLPANVQTVPTISKTIGMTKTTGCRPSGTKRIALNL